MWLLKSTVKWGVYTEEFTKSTVKWGVYTEEFTKSTVKWGVYTEEFTKYDYWNQLLNGVFILKNLQSKQYNLKFGLWLVEISRI